MKIPEPLFILINPVIRSLLTSPFHRLLSSSVLLIRFRGRNTGREFTTPVRYIRHDGAFHCFTGQSNQWWRNMRRGARVVLVVQGREVPCLMTATSGQPSIVKPALARLLAAFPQDAPYYDIAAQRGGTIKDKALGAAAARTVLVEAVPVSA